MASEYWKIHRKAKFNPSKECKILRLIRINEPDHIRLLQVQARLNLRSMREVVSRLLEVMHDRL